MGANQAELLARIPDQLLIGGQWVEGSGRFEVCDPASGEVLARVADAAAGDGLRALGAAVGAQDGWAATAPRQRSELLRRAFELVRERKDELALLMSLEMGKPLPEAEAEVDYGGEFLRWFAEEAVRISGRYGWNPEGTGRMIVSRRPVGPCLLITPWNFPLAMATRKVAPALAAGCAVVVKPAHQTPLTTLAFAQLLIEAGLPAGVVNVLPTTRSGEVSAPIIADPRLRKLSFTGSTPVGRRLIAQAAEGVLRVSMELGGDAPFLVFPDADLDAAVAGALAAKFRNIGQACTAANRFLVHEDVVDEFARRVAAEVAGMPVGPGTRPGVRIGPLIDEAGLAKAMDLVSDALGRGARLAFGGRRLEGPGHFMAPTVLTDVPPSARLQTEEIFGPVLAISTFADEDEAVELANATEYGLVAYVYTRDLALGHRMIDRLDAGMMGLNVGVVSNAAAPFGGVKQSGFGREGGPEGIHEYLETKYTLLPAG